MQLLSVKNLFRQDVGAMETFEIDEKGEQFDFPEEIEVASVKGKATAIKLEDTVAVSAKLTADTTLICDRCLDNFEREINFSFEREYTIDRKDESEDGLYVDKYGNVDPSGPIHDELLLSVPTQNFCRVDCPGICPHCGHNLNHEECTCKINK